MKIKISIGAKLQYLRAIPSLSTWTDIPKFTKPEHTLGYTVAGGGKEDKGRATCKERCLASWGDLIPEFTEEVNLFWLDSGPCRALGISCTWCFPPGCVGLTL